ncbi:ribulokinase [Paenibacillus sp. J2TS4]|uniref:ribulokinase n=1 Tax=Paenibacillus sp. J2TS4 TaxID=2807194 RepID=UPI001B0B87D4|nr:ribulokinase [Paenibacillus sp. J2TS4]GIP35459.1 ribulokinase [Paenibacillus sp. J2TS4]
MKYAIGIDFGTSSGRVLIVNAYTGSIAGISVCPYQHKVIEERLYEQPIPAGFSLQNSKDYMDVLKNGISEVLSNAKIDPKDIVGIGIDFTSSTMMVTDEHFVPLSWKEEHRHNPHAYVKLWKHHGASDEANRMMEAAAPDLHRYLGNYGLKVNSEWMIPKILELKNKAPDILKESAYIIEAGDWIVSKLTGGNVRSNCARGYKSFWNESDGFDFEFYEKTDPDLPDIIRAKCDGALVKIGQQAGLLTREMSQWLGLPANIPVAPAIIDAHSAVLGVGSTEHGQFTMVMGTSTCHLMLHQEQKQIPGISGSVRDAIIPGLYAYEAGQSAVGDLFESVVNQVPKEYADEAQQRNLSIYDLLEMKASRKKVGEIGVIALDWHNGNRSPLSDSDLTGVIIGQTLHTKPEDIYRAYMEATAFGTRMIMSSYEEYGLQVNEVFACGGLPQKNSLLIQIYADILNKPIHISNSDYAPAIGAAILGAVAGGQYEQVRDAVANMKQPLLKTVLPIRENVEKYNGLFQIYKDLHNYFGIDNRRILGSLQEIAER